MCCVHGQDEQGENPTTIVTVVTVENLHKSEQLRLERIAGVIAVDLDDHVVLPDLFTSESLLAILPKKKFNVQHMSPSEFQACFVPSEFVRL